MTQPENIPAMSLQDFQREWLGIGRDVSVRDALIREAMAVHPRTPEPESVKVDQRYKTGVRP